MKILRLNKKHFLILGLLCSALLLTIALIALWPAGTVTETGLGKYKEFVKIAASPKKLVPFPDEGSDLLIRAYAQNATPDKVYIVWEEKNRLNNKSVHREVAVDGLKPGRTYYYLVKGSAKIGRFHTPWPDLARNPFTFLVYGDSRTRVKTAGLVARQMQEIAPASAFIIHTGDFTTRGTQEFLWEREFWGVQNDLLAQSILYPCLGNHEFHSSFYYRYFNLPGNEQYYSFNWGQVHVAVLDNTVSPQEMTGQVDWLEQDLAAHKNFRYKVVIAHHPIYANKTDAVGQNMQDLIVPVLEKNKVTAVFNGHSHNYQHHLVNGIHYFVTGGAGAPLYNLGPPLPSTIKGAKIEHFLKVDVTSRAMNITAYDINGGVIEKTKVVP